jgi:hypothetical protein
MTDASVKEGNLPRTAGIQVTQETRVVGSGLITGIILVRREANSNADA